MTHLPRVLVVLPTYNEMENIQNVYRRIRNISQADILIIDDGSSDGTRELIFELKTFDEKIKYIFRDKKLGLGSAYRVSYEYALGHNYDFLIQCDADGSHEIEMIPEMLKAAISGADLVIGSRYIAGGSVIGWSTSRVIISKIGNFYSKLMLGLKTNDNTAGFRIFKINSLADIDFRKANANGYAFQVQMTYLFRNLKIVEIPINFVERQFGESKMTVGIALEALIQIPLLRFK